VPQGVEVPLPHFVDLTWLLCTECAHAWQPSFDPEQLAAIYRNFYYTPAPDGIATQFREDFLDFMQRSKACRDAQTILEIGASAGDVLEAVSRSAGATRAYAFEPNLENAAVARARGLDVRTKFFGADAGNEGLQPVDLIYARHVIEHVFEFPAFLDGIDAVTSPTACLVLETPGLDHHSARGSLDPFHIEHVHVFSLRSLVSLVASHGWRLVMAECTPSGNQIAAFRKSAASTDLPEAKIGNLQQSADARLARLRALLARRRLVFWGAGSSGVAMSTALGDEPDFWTDGNPAKIGRCFVGHARSVIAPEEALQGLAATGDPLAAVVITSAFAQEILPRLRSMGWAGAVFDANGQPL
jgi:hypothetical protein